MIAHSPPFGLHDDDDQPHVGFTAFVWLIKTFRPRYFLHGHTLTYKSNIEGSQSMLMDTQIININPYRLLEVEPHVQ
jgi:Icc-related predicted phosphoesterase